MRLLDARLASLEALARNAYSPTRIIRVIIGATDGKPDDTPRRYLERTPAGLVEIPEAEALLLIGP